jgi:hypothetical protein
MNAAEQYDPSILPSNWWYELFQCVQARCPCGNTASVRDGALTAHEPKSTWDINGKRRAQINDAHGIGWTCRYSGRTVTLAAALERDNALTPAERHARDATLRRLEAGIVDSAPDGYVLPKPVASLLAFAEANGWAVQQAWAPRDEGFLLNARVGRAATDGAKWQYDLSYFVAPGAARRTSFGLCTTPDRRAPHDTPSNKVIRAVIEQHPVLEAIS